MVVFFHSAHTTRPVSLIYVYFPTASTVFAYLKHILNGILT